MLDNRSVSSNIQHPHKGSNLNIELRPPAEIRSSTNLFSKLRDQILVRIQIKLPYMKIIEMDIKGIEKILITIVTTMPMGNLLVSKTRVIAKIFKNLFNKGSVPITITIGTKIETTRNALGGIKVHTQGCMTTNLSTPPQLLTVRIR